MTPEQKLAGLTPPAGSVQLVLIEERARRCPRCDGEGVQWPEFGRAPLLAVKCAGCGGRGDIVERRTLGATVWA